MISVRRHTCHIIVWMTHEFLSRSSMEYFIMVPGRYKDCVKSTMNRCRISLFELEALAMDRANLCSSCKSAVEKFEILLLCVFGNIPWVVRKRNESREWKQTIQCIQELESKRDLQSLLHHPPATLSARSASGCVVHRSGFLPTISPTRDDETRHVDGSVHDHRSV